MRDSEIKILAIDPGTKEIGIAILVGEEMVYYGVKTIRKRKPQQVLQQASRIIKSLIARYTPSVLAIERIPDGQKSSALLIAVVEKLEAAARSEGLTVHEYFPKDVRRAICKTGKATKLQTARILAQEYFELNRYLDRKSKWEQLYYANMLDAVAVAVYCCQEITTGNSTTDKAAPGE
jgi:Holliday junction resolvasome RuvABC endonuclease subunit